MKLITKINYEGKDYEIDLSQPINISIPVSRKNSPNAFYLPEPEFITVEAENFTGNVKRGGSCNVENIRFSPHGNGTHTECAGHVAENQTLITEVLTKTFFLAKLITVEYIGNGPNFYIDENQLKTKFPENKEKVEALIIRTLPNSLSKKSTGYSGKNTAYLHENAAQFIVNQNINHLLIDLPSLDKEDDNELKAHKIFFEEKNGFNLAKTVTEMVFVDDEVADGLYWLDLQVSPFESDASPSKPLLYKIRNIS